MAAIASAGASIAFGTSSFAADIISFNTSGWSRGSIETTHQGTTTDGRTFIPTTRYDPGTLELELQFDPGTDDPPMTADAETITITFSDADTFAASGFVTDFSIENQEDDKITASMTVKFTGDITITDVV